MRLAPLPAVALSALVLAGCSERQRLTADAGIWSVHSQLASMPPASDALDFAAQAPGGSYELVSGGNPLVWRFAIHGRDYCRFRVKLTELAPDRTRVESWAEKSDDAANAAAANLGGRPDYRYFCDVARIAGQESVKATLEGRPVDKTDLTRRIARNVAMDPLSVTAASAAAMDEAVRMTQPGKPCDEDPGGDACRAWKATRPEYNDLRPQPPQPTAPLPTSPVPDARYDR